MGRCAFPPMVPMTAMSPRSSPDGPTGPDGQRPQFGYLETSRRIDVWPDSVQVSGGTLAIAAAHPIRVWLSSGLRPVGHRDEAWLKRGLPSS